MGKIRDLPSIDKPREKAERFGIDSLKDEELLALIIDFGTVGHSSLDIARDLLDDCHYLNELLYKPKQYFFSFKGLKTAKALKLMAVIEIAKRISEKQRLMYEEKTEVTSDSLYRRYSITLAKMQQEVLAIVILNKNKQIIYERILYQGDDSNVAINSRDILRLLMIHNGYYFYLIHNHPNNSLYPSEFDVTFTKRIREKAKLFNVKLLDHLIISSDGYYSFLHDNLFKELEFAKNNEKSY